MTEQAQETLAKTYEPQTIETKWYQCWEKNDFFKPNQKGPAYCIMIPPPNVTGSLHMGHGFQDTLMDTLIRYHRMKGFNTLWQVGTDHAGIATQMVVEKQLAQQKTSRHDLGREEFTERVWQWKHESGGQITKQLRRLGTSVDWDRECFTMDEKFNHAVIEVFIRLYEEGLIYRGKRLVNWDPAFRSAISDLEVINSEEEGFLWHIRYPIVNSKDHLVIATTRPETMLGDVAVAVNPNDERYKHLIGKQIRLPLVDRIIPIIADDYVSPEFGTGCVKITPAHDFNDYQIGLRHDLPLINIFTEDAKINEHAPEKYQNLDRFVAREQIITDLKDKDLLEKVVPHKLNVPRADRGNTIIEPYLTNQWFVKMKPLAEPAIAAVKNKDIEFVPETWQKTYFQWLDNIEDWCISRQLWWGHRIPAWYDEKNNLYVGHTEQEVRKKYHLADEIKLTQDEDVLDTWFSSALWPFGTLGWPNETADLKTFYPTSVLVTGFDIIFFWVARMIMMGLKFTGEVPFKQVYYTGLIRDSEGHKMSKTKGNVLDPIDLIDGIDLETLVKKRTHGLMQPKMAEKIEKATRKEFPNGISAHGTDALRFTYCALATTGRDIRFDLNRLEGYRNFCNKIWNAARFALMHVTTPIPQPLTSNNLIDKWLYSRLQKTIANVTQNIDAYRFDLAAQTIYEFIWNEFCDWYVEFSKIILNSADYSDAEKNATRHTLIHCLETLLRVIHPMMPFISEEIWQILKPYSQKSGETIMLESYPVVDQTLIDEKVESEIAWLQKIIVSIRTIRSEMNVPPSKTITVIFNKGNALDHQLVNTHKQFLAQLAKAEELQFLVKDQPPPAAIAIVDQLEILIPLKGLIDKDAEIARLEKEINKLNKEREKIQNKLNSPEFINKAPKELVQRDQQRVKEIDDAIMQLQSKMAEIKNL
jgi:valyl-tRNA synthetase